VCGDIDVRRSLAEIARELPTLSRRSPLTGGIVRRMMARFAAAGFVAAAPGPRRGEGRTLTPKGAALVERLWSGKTRRRDAAYPSLAALRGADGQLPSAIPSAAHSISMRCFLRTSAGVKGVAIESELTSTTPEGLLYSVGLVCGGASPAAR
jgi:hypothetical protein